MEELKFKLTKEIILAAHDFELLRNSCKEYLGRAGRNYDKFTIVQHDSFIAYIAEIAIKQYIDEKYASDKINVSSWSEHFDIDVIKNILSRDSKEGKDIELVQEYYYDKYDLQLKYRDKTIYIDVKTALTGKEPSERWNFMYPVVQANKLGKDYMILTYYVVDDVKEIESMNKLILIGYISEEVIRRCKIIRKGETTRFGTTSQIDNYETELSVHYKDIDVLIKTLKEKE